MERRARWAAFIVAAAVVGCGGRSVGEPTQSGGQSGSGAGGTGGVTDWSSDGGTGGLVGGWTGGTGNTGATSACVNTDSMALDPAVAANGFFLSLYAFGDGDAGSSTPSSDADPGSTFCLDSPMDGTICMNGLAQEACGGMVPCDYHRWGAGFGLGLATRSDTGILTPFDATAWGVTGVMFTLTGATSPIRAQITIFNRETLGFIYGDPMGIVGDGTKAAQFNEFAQPPWGDPTLVLDPTQLDSIQFVVPSVAGSTTPYDFCVSNIQLVDATGTVVTPLGGIVGGGPR